MPTAHVNDVTLKYRIDGDGDDTVVLINGLADDLETWAYQTPALVEAGYRVLTFDNRGIGGSDMPPGPYTSRQLADDAAALVERLGIGDFHLMGVSMGGMVAQELVLAHPQKVRSLTLSNTYAAPGPFCSRMFALWADIAVSMGVPAVMRDVLLWAFTVPFFEDPERADELAEFEAEMAGHPQPVEAYLAQLSVIQTHDTTDRLGRINTPTLVVTGEQDILIPVLLSRRLHAAIPGAEWATVDGAHAAIWESPDVFNTTFLAFLERHRS